jgi:predicted SnoaL-like aldol condensation-catalyzing enzyme
MESAIASAHKQAATDFLRQAATGDVQQAFQSYVSDNFRHHNPHFRGDAKSLAAAMAENAAQNPDKTLRIERVIEEGDLVAVHSRVRLRPDTPEVALVHIFRFEGDRVAELWDIGQPEPENSPNENGMF